jgi:hypothetical protein
MASRSGPWRSRTAWGKLMDAINLAILIAILAFVVYKAYFP